MSETRTKDAGSADDNQQAKEEAARVERIGREAVDEARAATELALEKVQLASAADSVNRLAAFELYAAEESGDKAAVKAARKELKASSASARAEHKAANKAAKRAYDAVKFSQPGSLGFLHVIQVLFALSFASGIVQMMSYGKADFDLDPATILWLLTLVVDAVSFWLIWKRKAVTRWWVIITSALSIVVGSIISIASGSFSIVAQAMSSAVDIFLIVYFAVSRRARITLDEPFTDAALARTLDEEESYWKPWTWGFWRNLIIYFCVFSVVGHWMEAGVCLLIKYGIVPGTYDPESQIWSDWLYPFPVYGIGFCACAILLYPLKNWLQRKIHFKGGALIVSYIANALVCTAIEFIMGMATNQDLQLWDYSDMFCNFMGQVCLQNALFFGLAATTMTWLVYPALERQFRKLTDSAMMGLFVFVIAGFGILTALYLVSPPEKAASVQEEDTRSTETVQLMEERGFTQAEAESYEAAEMFGINPEFSVARAMTDEALKDSVITDEEYAKINAQLEVAQRYAAEHPDIKNTLTETAEAAGEE